MSRTTAFMAAALTAAIASFGITGSAEAGKKGVVVHVGAKHAYFHKHRRFIVASPVVYSGGGCSYYRDRWHDTGRFHWKSKYYHCMGWW